MIFSLVNVLINGLAYGVLLFLMAGGLSVTMGLMGFANLAHGSLAMLGGYILVILMNAHGWPFVPALAAAALGTMAAGVVVERAVFRRLYASHELDQVLLTIGIVTMTVAAATFIWGAVQAPMVSIPAWPRRAGCISATSISASTDCS